MSRSKRYIGMAILVLLLAAVRAFEELLFYDPLMVYFKRDYTAYPLPEFDTLRLSGDLLFRYVVNSLISLGIIHLAFQRLELTRFSAALYGVFFVILLGAFLISVDYFPDAKMLIFYIRRFIIHPLFLLLFLPAFFFQEKVVKEQ